MSLAPDFSRQDRQGRKEDQQAGGSGQLAANREQQAAGESGNQAIGRGGGGVERWISGSVEWWRTGPRSASPNLHSAVYPLACCQLLPASCSSWREESAMKSEDPPKMAGPAEQAVAPSHTELLREACTALLRDGQRVRFRATGLSMDPTIRDGDVLTVEPVDLGEVRPGEVLLCRTARGVIAHRLVRCEAVENQLLYVLRGDASGTCDPPVSYGDVLGLVTSFRRRRWSRSLTNPWAIRWQRLRAAATRLARAALRRLSLNSP